MGENSDSGQPSSLRRMYHVGREKGPRVYIADGTNTLLSTLTSEGRILAGEFEAPEENAVSPKLIYAGKDGKIVGITKFGQVAPPYDLAGVYMGQLFENLHLITLCPALHASVSLSSDTLDVLLEKGLEVDFIPRLKEPSDREDSVSPSDYRVVHGYILSPVDSDVEGHNVVVTTQWNYSRHPDFSRKLWIVSSGGDGGVTASPVSYGSLAEAGSVVTTLPFGKGFWFGASKAAQRKAEDPANTRRVALSVVALERNVTCFDDVPRHIGIQQFKDHLHHVAKELGLDKRS